eukprot:4857922-Amphidinium_carterae.1
MEAGSTCTGCARIVGCNGAPNGLRPAGAGAAFTVLVAALGACSSCGCAKPPSSAAYSQVEAYTA